MKQIIAVCFCFAVLAGCASNPPGMGNSGSGQPYLGYTSDPINRFAAMNGIRSWESISDEYLVMRTTRNKAYLVKVWMCPKLPYARSVQVISAMPSTVRRSDKIVADGDSCMIREIRQIDVLKLKADQAASTGK